VSHPTGSVESSGTGSIEPTGEQEYDATDAVSRALTKVD
jgi:hypothetical protein